jgi:hypothetical protein
MIPMSPHELRLNIALPQAFRLRISRGRTANRIGAIDGPGAASAASAPKIPLPRPGGLITDPKVANVGVGDCWAASRVTRLSG